MTNYRAEEGREKKSKKRNLKLMSSWLNGDVAAKIVNFWTSALSHATRVTSEKTSEEDRGRTGSGLRGLLRDSPGHSLTPTLRERRQVRLRTDTFREREKEGRKMSDIDIGSVFDEKADYFRISAPYCVVQGRLWEVRRRGIRENIDRRRKKRWLMRYRCCCQEGSRQPLLEGECLYSQDALSGWAGRKEREERMGSGKKEKPAK